MDYLNPPKRYPDNPTRRIDNPTGNDSVRPGQEAKRPLTRAEALQEITDFITFLENLGERNMATTLRLCVAYLAGAQDET